MSIREAVEADIPGMQRVRESVRENELPDYGVLTVEMYRDHLLRLGRGWVCEREGRIVGFAIANLVDASVWALFVEPEWEGREIGRSLHDAMLEWLRSRGAMRVTLCTAPGTRAARFYEAAGWKACGTAENGDTIYARRLGRPGA